MPKKKASKAGKKKAARAAARRSAPSTGNVGGAGSATGFRSAEDASALPVLVEQLAQHALTLGAPECEQMLRDLESASEEGGYGGCGVRGLVEGRLAQLRTMTPERLAEVQRAIAEDEDEDEDEGASMYGFEGGSCGFTAGECDELMEQGIKPWDDDAHAALGALHDY
jgi:hypothetical protein